MFLCRLVLMAFILGLFSGFAGNAYAEKGSKKGQVTGLDMPRFVTLRASKVSARTGPALKYPVQWLYKRVNLPVEVIAEFDAWRQVRDFEGSIGWVHSSLLSSRRYAYVQHDQNIFAYKKAEIDPKKRSLEIEPGTLGKVLKCKNTVCLLDFTAYRGWVEKKYLWGIYDSEVIE